MLPLPSKSLAATQVESPGVLLVYDSLAIGTPYEGNVEALQRILASFGVQVTLRSYDQYEAGTMSKYSKVIDIHNVDDMTALPDSFSQDMNKYNGDYMHIGNHLPAKIGQALHLEEQTQSQDTIRIEIGKLTQHSISVNGISYITKYSGNSYGQITSENRRTSVPYSVSNGKYAYIPYMVKGNLSEQAASFVLKDWLAVTTPSHYYVLLNEIYPFSDLDLLNEMADRLYSAGIPFIASVQPVFGNQDFPAMQRYLESLKHVQSRNGNIVVNAPVVESTTSPDVLGLKSQMSAFLDALAGYSIVPLGISSELYWTYDQHYTEQGLSFFDSGIILPNNRLRYRSQTTTSSVFAGKSMYTITAEELSKYSLSNRTLDPLPMDTALVYPFPENRKDMETMLDTMLASWTTFTDYKNVPHTVRTEANEMTSRSGHLQINGAAVLLNNSMQEIDSEHMYVQETKKSFTALFTLQNNIFIVLIIATLFIFMVFLIIGHRLYKRKFTHQGRSL
ncbi:hypothetical protein [Paenibacillus pectinilyticus]|nr:hypothetical protein [Paenibacillus pectinilyticus]